MASISSFISKRVRAKLTLLDAALELDTLLTRLHAALARLFVDNQVPSAVPLPAYAAAAGAARGGQRQQHKSKQEDASSPAAKAAQRTDSSAAPSSLSWIRGKTALLDRSQSRGGGGGEGGEGGAAAGAAATGKRSSAAGGGGSSPFVSPLPEQGLEKLQQLLRQLLLLCRQHRAAQQQQQHQALAASNSAAAAQPGEASAAPAAPGSAGRPHHPQQQQQRGSLPAETRSSTTPPQKEENQQESLDSVCCAVITHRLGLRLICGCLHLQRLLPAAAPVEAEDATATTASAILQDALELLILLAESVAPPRGAAPTAAAPAPPQRASAALAISTAATAIAAAARPEDDSSSANLWRDAAATAAESPAAAAGNARSWQELLHLFPDGAATEEEEEDDEEGEEEGGEEEKLCRSRSSSPPSPAGEGSDRDALLLCKWTAAAATGRGPDELALGAAAASLSVGPFSSTSLLGGQQHFGEWLHGESAAGNVAREGGGAAKAAGGAGAHSAEGAAAAAGETEVQRGKEQQRAGPAAPEGKSRADYCRLLVNGILSHTENAGLLVSLLLLREVYVQRDTLLLLQHLYAFGKARRRRNVLLRRQRRRQQERQRRRRELLRLQQELQQQQQADFLMLEEEVMQQQLLLRRRRRRNSSSSRGSHAAAAWGAYRRRRFLSRGNVLQGSPGSLPAAAAEMTAADTATAATERKGKAGERGDGKEGGHMYADEGEASACKVLEDAFLSRPECLSYLLATLQEKTGAAGLLVNEALELLRSLSCRREELKVIATFQGAIEALLTLVFEELDVPLAGVGSSSLLAAGPGFSAATAAAASLHANAASAAQVVAAAPQLRPHLRCIYTLSSCGPACKYIREANLLPSLLHLLQLLLTAKEHELKQAALKQQQQQRQQHHVQQRQQSSEAPRGGLGEARDGVQQHASSAVPAEEPSPCLPALKKDDAIGGVLVTAVDELVLLLLATLTNFFPAVSALAAWRSAAAACVQSGHSYSSAALMLASRQNTSCIPAAAVATTAAAAAARSGDVTSAWRHKGRAAADAVNAEREEQQQSSSTRGRGETAAAMAARSQQRRGRSSRKATCWREAELRSSQQAFLKGGALPLLSQHAAKLCHFVCFYFPVPAALLPLQHRARAASPCSEGAPAAVTAGEDASAVASPRVAAAASAAAEAPKTAASSGGSDDEHRSTLLQLQPELGPALLRLLAQLLHLVLSIVVLGDTGTPAGSAVEQALLTCTGAAGGAAAAEEAAAATAPAAPPPLYCLTSAAFQDGVSPEVHALLLLTLDTVVDSSEAVREHILTSCLSAIGGRLPSSSSVSSPLPGAAADLSGALPPLLLSRSAAAQARAPSAAAAGAAAFKQDAATAASLDTAAAAEKALLAGGGGAVNSGVSEGKGEAAAVGREPPPLQILPSGLYVASLLQWTARRAAAVAAAERQAAAAGVWLRSLFCVAPHAAASAAAANAADLTTRADPRTTAAESACSRVGAAGGCAPPPAAGVDEASAGEGGAACLHHEETFLSSREEEEITAARWQQAWTAVRLLLSAVSSSSGKQRWSIGTTMLPRLVADTDAQQEQRQSHRPLLWQLLADVVPALLLATQRYNSSDTDVTAAPKAAVVLLQRQQQGRFVPEATRCWVEFVCLELLSLAVVLCCSGSGATGSQALLPLTEGDAAESEELRTPAAAAAQLLGTAVAWLVSSALVLPALLMLLSCSQQQLLPLQGCAALLLDRCLVLLDQRSRQQLLVEQQQQNLACGEDGPRSSSRAGAAAANRTKHKLQFREAAQLQQLTHAELPLSCYFEDSDPVDLCCGSSSGNDSSTNGGSADTDAARGQPASDAPAAAAGLSDGAKCVTGASPLEAAFLREGPGTAATAASAAAAAAAATEARRCFHRRRRHTQMLLVQVVGVPTFCMRVRCFLAAPELLLPMRVFASASAAWESDEERQRQREGGDAQQRNTVARGAAGACKSEGAAAMPETAAAGMPDLLLCFFLLSWQQQQRLRGETSSSSTTNGSNGRGRAPAVDGGSFYLRFLPRTSVLLGVAAADLELRALEMLMDLHTTEEDPGTWVKSSGTEDQASQIEQRDWVQSGLRSDVEDFIRFQDETIEELRREIMRLLARASHLQAAADPRREVVLLQLQREAQLLQAEADRLQAERSRLAQRLAVERRAVALQLGEQQEQLEAVVLAFTQLEDDLRVKEAEKRELWASLQAEKQHAARLCTALEEKFPQMQDGTSAREEDAAAATACEELSVERLLLRLRDAEQQLATQAAQHAALQQEHSALLGLLDFLARKVPDCLQYMCSLSELPCTYTAEFRALQQQLRDGPEGGGRGSSTSSNSVGDAVAALPTQRAAAGTGGEQTNSDPAVQHVEKDAPAAAHLTTPAATNAPQEAATPEGAGFTLIDATTTRVEAPATDAAAPRGEAQTQNAEVAAGAWPSQEALPRGLPVTTATEAVGGRAHTAVLSEPGTQQPPAAGDSVATAEPLPSARKASGVDLAAVLVSPSIVIRQQQRVEEEQLQQGIEEEQRHAFAAEDILQLPPERKRPDDVQEQEGRRPEIEESYPRGAAGASAPALLIDVLGDVPASTNRSSGAPGEASCTVAPAQEGAAAAEPSAVWSEEDTGAGSSSSRGLSTSGRDAEVAEQNNHGSPGRRKKLAMPSQSHTGVSVSDAATTAAPAVEYPGDNCDSAVLGAAAAVADGRPTTANPEGTLAVETLPTPTPPVEKQTSSAKIGTWGRFFPWGKRTSDWRSSGESHSNASESVPQQQQQGQDLSGQPPVGATLLNEEHQDDPPDATARGQVGEQSQLQNGVASLRQLQPPRQFSGVPEDGHADLLRVHCNVESTTKGTVQPSDGRTMLNVFPPHIGFQYTNASSTGSSVDISVMKSSPEAAAAASEQHEVDNQEIRRRDESHPQVGEAQLHPGLSFQRAGSLLHQPDELQQDQQPPLQRHPETPQQEHGPHQRQQASLLEANPRPASHRTEQEEIIVQENQEVGDAGDGNGNADGGTAVQAPAATPADAAAVAAAGPGAAAAAGYTFEMYWTAVLKEMENVQLTAEQREELETYRLQCQQYFHDLRLQQQYYCSQQWQEHAGT